GADGKWSLELAGALRDGNHSFVVTATDLAGNTSAQSNSWSVLVDTNSTTPAITGVVDNVAGGTVGAIANGGLTNDNKPTLNGTAEANAIVTIREGGNVLGSVKAGADGKWSLELAGALRDGNHSFVVTAVDPAGNTSAQS
ncbi:Ig-like domain-containing protein, partial [Pantoea sp. GbtcB22]|uniref:Ig-like domain-containing protein n=1 Tax=Pantoea sp. GbtcB22 TaxID=2824767 RepID=UPI001C2F2CBB